MFRSYDYLRYNREIKTYEFKIIDSNFAVVVICNVATPFAVALVREYTQRNFSVAKNIVLYCIYRSGTRNLI